MSKKSKRQTRKVISQPVMEPTNASVNTPKQPSFNPDYSYVKKDLRRIAILVSSFVIILIVLTFFLR